jgi:DNA-binding phage protein
MATMNTDIADLLRNAINGAPSVNGVAVKADVSEGVLRRFLLGGGITLETAQKVANALGMKLVLR